ncbi:MAG: SUMF1/EgtB/PvdO family nonheme iron enzyme [Acidobacteriota bacterium]|nr:SUMF1/EgtB/PvdO family nonheme iron enzyme [Acidobacteriota bacterium]
MKICLTCQQSYSDDVEFCPRDSARLAAQGTEAGAKHAAGLSRRFRLIRRLGKGGMGMVFLAEQIGVENRRVALKVLTRKLLDDPDFLLRFQNEAGSAGRIHHPNVVSIYESGQADDGTPYIAMEFLEGESLRQALARRGAIPVVEVAEILQQAARGLNAAHKLGIIHRDLKPDNIFLTYPDDAAAPLAGAHDAAAIAQDVGAGLVPALPVGIADTGQAQDPPLRPVVVKIVDFGIAKLRESGAHTQTGMVLGTPAYMSYEQASGMRSDELDARSDIYSLGVVVYEMLTGRTPFHSDTTLGYLRQHVLEPPPPFREVAPDLPVPSTVESAVMKALVKDRNRRYASALDFARELTSAAQFSPPAETHVHVPSPRIVAPPTKPPVVRETDVSKPLPGSAQAKVVPAVQTPPLSPPQIITEPPTAQPQGSKPAAAKPPWPRTAPEPPSAMRFVAIAVVAVILTIVGVWYFLQQGTEKGDTSSPSKAGPSQGEVRVDPKDGLKYVWITSGTFMMGCSPGDTECAAEEKPTHQVTITKGFWLGKTEVTVGAYKRFTGAMGLQMPPEPYYSERPLNPAWGDEAMPIVDVTWDDAQAYCSWAGGRLPTEAEWEYAARGGSAEARYGPIEEVAWYFKNSGLKTDEVGKKRANGFGLYDMLGNVWEWVNDWCDQSYYQNSPLQDPTGPVSGQFRILRGGSWVGVPKFVRVSVRLRVSPAFDSNNVGFRCVGEVFAP